MRYPDDLARPAARSGTLLCTVLLLASGCTTTLNRAIERDQGKAVDGYLASGANVNEADKDGATPLINAAQYGNLALIQRLVERGANVNAADKQGNSALSYLASGDTYKNDAASFLLAHGADVNRANYRSLTPLVLASMRSCDAASADPQAELLAILIKGGANPNEQGPTGELPLHLAVYAGQPDKAIECLIQATKDPHALTFSGYGAFTEAARGDRRATALYLASRGFGPQMLVPDAPRTGFFPPSPDVKFSINARSQDFYGDVLSGRHLASDALASYRASIGDYEAAMAQYREAIDQFAAALKKEKSARNSKIMGEIALDVLGGGLAAATGVGFVVVPKRSVNDIDNFEEMIDLDKAELAALTKERSDLDGKIQAVQAQQPPAPAAGT
jgi:ankyrin repeat protein